MRRHPVYPWLVTHMGLLACLKCFASTSEWNWRCFVRAHKGHAEAERGMPAGARELIAWVNDGKVHSLDMVGRVRRRILRNNFQETLEPLWRACNFLLTGDTAHLRAAPQIEKVIEEVLETLRAAGVPWPEWDGVEKGGDDAENG